MEQGAGDGKSVASIAIMVFLFIIVLGIVIGIVVFGQRYFNKNMSTLTEQMDSTDMLRYSAYDNTALSGSDILTAVKTLQSNPMKIYVANKGANGGNVYKPDELSLGTGTVGTVQSYGYMGVGPRDTAPAFDTKLGSFVADIIPADVDSEVINTNFSPLTDKNNRECYVKSSGSYWGYMVLDENTGVVSAILFVQTK